MNEDVNNPFGTPPVGFMQTGNQTFDSPVTGGDAPFGEALSPAAPVGFTAASESNMANPFETGASDPDFQPPATTAPAKYRIVDMFWLINPKFYAKQQPVQSEAHFVILSFNLDFGNMRIAFFNLTNNSIQNNIVYLENLKRLVTGTMYPATAFNVHNSSRVATTCLEQLFKQTGANWQQERPVCTVEKDESKIRFSIRDPKNGNYFYDFTGWQREAFLHACNFSFTKGFEISAQSK
jgi:hypothetical protein